MNKLSRKYSFICLLTLLVCVVVFSSYGAATGQILRQYWLGINGSAVADLKASANYPNNPSGSDYLTSFEGINNWNNTYGCRIVGYLYPMMSGNYTFWIASDDASELLLSTDSTPGNKQIIAKVSTLTNSREWTKFGEQKSGLIYLTAGSVYYIEANMKDSTGDDHLAVAWQPPYGVQAVIPGMVLSPFIPTTPTATTTAGWSVPVKTSTRTATTAGTATRTATTATTAGTPTRTATTAGTATRTATTSSTPTRTGTIVVAGTPTKTPTPVPTTDPNGYAVLVQAEDYTAYSDSTTGNSGGCYRTDDVDIESCSEGGFNVGYIVSSEWLEYTVTIPKTDAYNLYFRVASPALVSSAFSISIDGVVVTQNLTVPNTNSWQSWSDTIYSGCNITAGSRKIKISANGGFNFNYMYLVSGTNPPSPTPAPGSGPTPAKPANYTGIVNTYGQLKVVGTNLCDKNGTAIQLRGMSSHGLQYFPFYKGHTIANLAYTWNIDIIRPAMYVEDYKNGEFVGGYIAQPTYMKNKLKEYLDDAIAVGIYVMVDWHLHNNPLNFKTQAIAFYKEMATTYGSYPNIIYEICNEPENTSWDDVKTYANAVIPEIRKIDPDNIILVGTPTWCQEVNLAADSPLTGYTNIMYTMHFYAGTHTQWLRDRCDYALGKGLPIFVSEFGVSDSTGGSNQTLYLTEGQTWITYLDNKKISRINWSFCNKGESSAALKPGVSLLGPWADSDISESGKFIKPKM